MSLDDLLHQLTAPQWEARVDAVRGLAALDDERARNALGWALYDDGDDAVVQAAAELMIASGDWGHVEPLVAALENAAEHKSDVIGTSSFSLPATHWPTRSTAGAVTDHRGRDRLRRRR